MNVRPRGNDTVVETQQFMHQHDAERLGMLPLTQRGIVGQRLELARGLPQVLIEEEEAGLELGFGETQFGIDQRPARIDVEVREARQRARLLPAEEPVAGRNEAQFVAEFVQPRFR